jgi:chloramphenicol 3-O-phosphotransferase
MKTGTIIILNSTSSSDKSTLIRMLQNALCQPCLEFGLDKLIWMLPKRYFSPPLWDEVLGKADQAGQYGHQLVHAMHRAIRSLAEYGLNILVDHVLIEPGWVIDCAGQLGDLNAYLIGLKCDLSILEMREKHRKDMTLGQARAQFGKVHEHVSYDFLVD